jgi:hypothetical protein
MKKEIEIALTEEQKRLDELFFQLGDVLDVKASIVLVAVSFLGAISGQDFAPPSPSRLRQIHERAFVGDESFSF